MPRQASFVVRPATDADIPAVHAIYSSYVLHGFSTFEEVPPGVEVLLERKKSIVDAGLPYVVAASEDQVCGYAYATLYRPRSAYRYTVEDSIYVCRGFHRQGIGGALLSRLIDNCESAGFRQMIAIIGDSANYGSIALHQRLGFQLTGTLRSVGYKLGRWVDTVVLQRPLGPGDCTFPATGEPIPRPTPPD